MFITNESLWKVDSRWGDTECGINDCCMYGAGCQRLLLTFIINIQPEVAVTSQAVSVLRQ